MEKEIAALKAQLAESERMNAELMKAGSVLQGKFQQQQQQQEELLRAKHADQENKTCMDISKVAPEYHGGSEPLEPFLRALNAAFNLPVPPSAAVKRYVLAMALKGKAREWLHARTQSGAEDTYESLLAALRATYGDPLEASRIYYDLQALTQTGSVAEYTTTFSSLMNRSLNLEAGTALHFYTAGLRQDIRLALAMSTQQPTTWHEASHIALRIDLFKKGASLQSPAHALQPQPQPQPQAPTPMVLGALGASGSGGDQRQCFRCGHTGHLIAQCPVSADFFAGRGRGRGRGRRGGRGGRDGGRTGRG